MSYSTIGGEFELNLINKGGYLSNRSQQILDDPQNDGSIVYEATKAQVEINSAPAETVQGLKQDVKKKFKLLEEICNTHNVSAIPVSEYGAGRGQIKRSLSRIDAYILAMGESLFRRLITNSGMHLHISQSPGKELEQFCLLYSLDPLSYAITSTSPISHRRDNGLNCHRINIIRYISFREFPTHAQLQDYPGSLEEIQRRNQERWDHWRTVSIKKGMDPACFDKTFQPDNTGYAPVRKRDCIGPAGTFEIRTFDTAPLDTILAAAALYKGCNDHLIRSGIEINVAEEENFYDFNCQQIILPTHDTLLRMEREAIQQGLRSDLVANYLSHALTFAEQGIPPKDLPYLEPLREMLETRMNPADQIMRYMRGLGYTDSRFTPEQSALANLFMREWHLRTLS